MNTERHRTFTITAWLAGLLLVAAVAPGPVQAQSGHASAQAGHLLQQMHMANQVQIKAAMLAGHKAQAPPVQHYADRLWRDHQVAAGKIQALAKGMGIALKSPAQMHQAMQQMQASSGMAMGGARAPMQMQKMQKNMQMMQHMMAKLKSASGAQFDRAYVDAMMKSQQHMVHMLQQAQPRAGGKLKVLIGKLVPILEQHVALARHLHERLAGQGGRNGS